MQIEKLTTLIKSKTDKRSKEESFFILKEANILDEDGFYDPNWFSEETVRKDRRRNGG